MSYVLVQYQNQTRKLPGDPSRKKYGTLVKQICDKFAIEHEIEIQVFDRENDQYFSIDHTEVREIANHGKIKVIRARKNGPSRKKKGSPMKPPGVPPQSREDDQKRTAWKKGAAVEIFSEGEKKWMGGDIVDIYNDREGEWLVIRYAGNRSKEIQRFSNYVRPKENRRGRQSGDARNQRDSKQRGGGDERKNQKPREPKPPKVTKVTTQSKYKRKDRVPPPEPPENVVEFKGTGGSGGRIKQYIDRAALLLRGPKEVPEEELKTEPAGDADSAEEKASAKKKAPKHFTPTKKWDVVHLCGGGRAMANVVAAAEIIKRIVPGLHQQTQMETNELVDVYTPTEAGLKDVSVSRSMTAIRVTLSATAQGVEASAVGYQEPEDLEKAFPGAIDYQYPDEKKKGRAPRGRGGGGGGRRRGGQ